MAAVMRSMAQQMGASSAPRHSHSHSIGSSDGGYTSGSNLAEELSRSTSRLAPPNPATVYGSPSGGILINATRPAHPGRINSNESFASSSSGGILKRNGNSSTSLASLFGRENAGNPSPSHSRTISLATPETDERGRTASREAGRGTTTSPNGTAGSGSRKIRFAPLPEVRARSYSTGRNVWLDEDNADITEGQARTPHLMRKDLPRDAADEDALDTDSDSDEEEVQGRGLFGSWRSESGFGGMGGSTSKKENDDGYATKLLRPLSFGLGKKKVKRSPSADGSLTRTISADSDASSRPSIDSQTSAPVKSTGVPMRKTRTWEPSDTAPRESRRANYPPVAQRSKTRAKQPAHVAAPEFVEWGGAGGVGSVLKATGVEDEDDGSGMAWIKKRRAQREAEAKLKVEQEAAAAAAVEEEGSSTPIALHTSSTIPIPHSTVEAPALILTEPYSPALSTSGAGSGTTTPVPRTSNLSNTRPQLQLVPSSPHIPTLSADDDDGDSSHDSDSPITPFDDDREDGLASKGSTDSSPVSAAGRLAVEPHGVALIPSDGEGSDEDEDDEEEEAGEKDEDDDLDPEELAREEALAAEARKSAFGTGAERYHDKDHKSRMLNVDGSAKAAH